MLARFLIPLSFTLVGSACVVPALEVDPAPDEMAGIGAPTAEADLRWVRHQGTVTDHRLRRVAGVDVYAGTRHQATDEDGRFDFRVPADAPRQIDLVTPAGDVRSQLSCDREFGLRADLPLDGDPVREIRVFVADAAPEQLSGEVHWADGSSPRIQSLDPEDFQPVAGGVEAVFEAPSPRLGHALVFDRATARLWRAEDVEAEGDLEFLLDAPEPGQVVGRWAPSEASDVTRVVWEQRLPLGDGTSGIPLFDGPPPDGAVDIVGFPEGEPNFSFMRVLDQAPVSGYEYVFDAVVDGDVLSPARLEAVDSPAILGDARRPTLAVPQEAFAAGLWTGPEGDRRSWRIEGECTQRVHYPTAWPDLNPSEDPYTYAIAQAEGGVVFRARRLEFER